MFLQRSGKLGLTLMVVTWVIVTTSQTEHGGWNVTIMTSYKQVLICRALVALVSNVPGCDYSVYDGGA